ncbi:hypothetical protein [Actinacidiphila bryophytorum]|nr:hypothetical protein [Actinacidiphila bryophytorum]
MPGTVRVVFVDAADGSELGRTELSAGQLPGPFASAMRLELAGEPWDVVRAEPPDAGEFVAGGSLVLRLSRVQVAAPEDVSYSLATICDTLPPTGTAQAGAGALFGIHQDDWRQTEMLSRQVAAEAEAELRAIRRIHREHSRLVGQGHSALRAFDMIHIRWAPRAPLAGADVCGRRLSSRRRAGSIPYEGVTHDGGRSRATDSFPINVGSLTLHGQTYGDHVEVLCLTPSPSTAAEPAAVLAQAMCEYDLVLVDWCTATVRDPSGIGEFLA